MLIADHEGVDIQEQYFDFEKDFLEDNIRCIPMMVRFKLDAAAIKLKLAEWSRFTVAERNLLATLPCHSEEEVMAYRGYLYRLILVRTGNRPTDLVQQENPAWADVDTIDPGLLERACSYNWTIGIARWKSLNNLQRFALLKLYRPGHESKNFPKAMKEFGLAG